MSVRALTWSFALPLQDMAAKAVLHALADHADENWRCWPSIKRIALFAGCSENTARRALQRVEAMGIVRREARAGQSDVFHLNADFTPSQVGTPPRMAPLPTEHEPLPGWEDTPPKLTGDPSQVGTRTTKEPPKNRQSNRQPESADEQQRTLPGDWQPSPDSWGYAIDRALDPGSTTEAFVDYFTQGRGRREKRTKAGWERRFRIWCNVDAERRAPSRAAGPMGHGKARSLHAPRGNDPFFEQLADIASRDHD